MGPELLFHLICERRDLLLGDEECWDIEEIQEDLVAVAESRAKVEVSRGATGAQLLGSKLPLDQENMIG